MQLSKGTLVLAGFCVLLSVTAVVFVVRSGSPPPPVAPMPAAPEVAPGPRLSPSEPLALSPPAVPAPAPEPERDPSTRPPAPPQPPVPPEDQDPETALKKDPTLVVPPVDEPDMSITTDVSQRPDFVAPLPNGGGYTFDRRNDKGKRVASGVVVPGLVLITRGLVELFGCGEGGKEHETILRLECDVQSLDLALTTAGFNRGNLPPTADIRLPGQGSRVIALVQWSDENGKPVTYRSEDLVVSLRRKRPMPRVGWTYVAQWAEIPDPTSPKGEKKHKVLAAANSRSYVTTFRDASALLDNPLEEAIDDTLFAANYMILPRPGTPVRVIFRTPLGSEVKEISELEQAIAKETPIKLRHGLHREDQK